MLEGLDQIDWDSLGIHVYGENEKIPDAIRNLLSQNSDVREEARAFLLGWGQDYGDIYDTTSYIVPYILEILGSPETPGKEGLLDHLSSVARSIWESNNLSVRKMRLYIKTYDSLRAGLGILISLLHNISITVQLAAIDMLQYMTDEVEILIPEFIRCVNSENDEDVQVALLKGLKTLLSSLKWFRDDLKEQCEPFLYKIVDTHPSQKVRITGAHASVEVYERYARRNNILPQNVAILLSDEFIRISKSVDYHGWSKEFDQAEAIVRDLAQLGYEPLLNLLRNPTINAVQAHLITRGLLSNIMGLGANDSYWKYSRSIDKKVEGLYYLYNYGTAYNIGNSFRHREHFDPVLQALQALIDNEKVWEIPTNIFSFFCDLPDSREELNAILKSTP